MKLNGKTILKIAVSLGLMLFFLSTTGIQETFQELSTANLWYLPLGVAIYLASQLISAFRWQMLSSALGFKLALREYYDYYLMGMFFSLFLPGAIGGDVSRMYYLAKSQDRKKREALLTLLAERGVGLVALLILTSIVCLTPVTHPIPEPIRYGLLGLSGAGILGFILLKTVPLQPLIQRYPNVSLLQLLDQARIYWQDLGLLTRSVSISLVVHAAMVGVHMLIAQALGLHIHPLYLMAVYGIVGLASVLPISFNGIGVREGAYLFLLQKIGIPAHEGLAFGLYWFLISSLTSLFGGIVLLRGHYRTPQLQEVSVLDN